MSTTMITGSWRRVRLGVCMDSNEMSAVEQLARKEFLTPSALVRRIILRECEMAGISPRRDEPPLLNQRLQNGTNEG